MLHARHWLAIVSIDLAMQCALGCEYTRHKDGITAGGIILQQSMTLWEAKVKCAELPNCRGFTFGGEIPADNASQPIEFHFKDHGELGGPGWSSFIRVDHQKQLDECEAKLVQSRAAFEHFHGTSNEFFYREHNQPISPGGLITQETMTIAEAKRRCAELTNCAGFTFPGHPTNESVHIELKDKSELGGEGEWTSYLREDYKHAASSPTETRTSELEASNKALELKLAESQQSITVFDHTFQEQNARIAELERQHQEMEQKAANEQNGRIAELERRNQDLEQTAAKVKSSEESCKKSLKSLEHDLSEREENLKQLEELHAELKWKLDEKTAESQRRATLLVVGLVVGVLSIGYLAKGGRKGSHEDNFCSKHV
eukprot:TRINITY_DN77579_c0_g1_i1.p1 TRINITY_DN77579_c0_g1~~TRINITY_DN77579_c0_g1_i1.p1  ORF type:complete len:372 (-),score=67.48 TRINITY_DN77579_c0_g1_i1:57-1172(-)